MLIIDGIRIIAPDVALTGITATGAVPGAGERPPVRTVRATWVLVDRADGWRVSALWALPSEDDVIIRSGQ